MIYLPYLVYVQVVISETEFLHSNQVSRCRLYHLTESTRPLIKVHWVLGGCVAAYAWARNPTYSLPNWLTSYRLPQLSVLLISSSPTVDDRINPAFTSA